MKKFWVARRAVSGHVDLALVQALDELVRRDVDQDDVGRLLKHAVGHGLSHDDAGNARDDVGEALEVLDVERRPDVDAGVEQLLDVLPALGMAAFGGVGVGELVDDDQLGLARRSAASMSNSPIVLAAILDHAARQNFESLEQGAGFGAPVRFDEADDDVDALVFQAARALQHGVGLADAGAAPTKTLSRPDGFPTRCRQQRVRVRASVIGAARLGHQHSSFVTTTLADPAPSSAATR